MLDLDGITESDVAHSLEVRDYLVAVARTNH